MTATDKQAALTFFYVRFRDLMADFALSDLREELASKGARENYRQVIKFLGITLCNLRATALSEFGADALKTMEQTSL